MSQRVGPVYDGTNDVRRTAYATRMHAVFFPAGHGEDIVADVGESRETRREMGVFKPNDSFKFVCHSDKIELRLPSCELAVKRRQMLLFRKIAEPAIVTHHLTDIWRQPRRHQSCYTNVHNPQSPSFPREKSQRRFIANKFSVTAIFDFSTSKMYKFEIRPDAVL
jgi:hypothetical protein